MFCNKLSVSVSYQYFQILQCSLAWELSPASVVCLCEWLLFFYQNISDADHAHFNTFIVNSF